ncbi:unnamed protein product, partial [Ixodes pacificus]
DLECLAGRFGTEVRDLSASLARGAGEVRRLDEPLLGRRLHDGVHLDAGAEHLLVAGAVGAPGGPLLFGHAQEHRGEGDEGQQEDACHRQPDHQLQVRAVQGGTLHLRTCTRTPACRAIFI